MGFSMDFLQVGIDAKAEKALFVLVIELYGSHAMVLKIHAMTRLFCCSFKYV